MAVRIRKDGTIICAAKSGSEDGDCYLDDGVHYRLYELGILHSNNDEDDTWYFQTGKEKNRKIIISDKWPEAISDGLSLPCSICGIIPMFDYHVDDDFWSRIVPGHIRRDVICLPCLDGLAHNVQLDVAEHIEFVHFTGIGKTVVLIPERTYYYEKK